jgi:hypothetical protein
MTTKAARTCQARRLQPMLLPLFSLHCRMACHTILYTSAPRASFLFPRPSAEAYCPCHPWYTLVYADVYRGVLRSSTVIYLRQFHRSVVLELWAGLRYRIANRTTRFSACMRLGSSQDFHYQVLVADHKKSTVPVIHYRFGSALTKSVRTVAVVPLRPLDGTLQLSLITNMNHRDHV